MPVDREAVLVTGGAGFIGRWVVNHLLKESVPPRRVVVLDNLSNGSRENLAECEKHPDFLEFVQGDICDETLLDALFGKYRFHTVFHLAARIDVQESINDPGLVFRADVVGTFGLLERARDFGSRFVFVSTCMVYDRCASEQGISERDAVKPASPYAGAKLAAENLALGHHFAYGLPVTILRPFNTYGPLQKSTGEGGVVSIFCEKELAGEDLMIYGDGTQTRDFLFVTDCARFIVEAGFRPEAEGVVLNAGSGSDVTINELASLVCSEPARIKHVRHIHPQSEIMKLKCNRRLAERLIGWTPSVGLAEGIGLTTRWLKARNRETGR